MDEGIIFDRVRSLRLGGAPGASAIALLAATWPDAVRLLLTGMPVGLVWFSSASAISDSALARLLVVIDRILGTSLAESCCMLYNSRDFRGAA